MSEEFKPMPDIDPNEDLTVTGKHKSHKKKKSKPIYTILIVLLLGVMGYSGYQIAATLIRDKNAQSTYDGIKNEFVVELPPDATMREEPVTTVPEPTESASETLPPATESAEVIIPVESTEDETVPPTQPELDPMRILSVDFDKLRSVNGDVCAWIQGQGGVMSYPVVQGKDNEYYLKHLIDGSWNGNGTLFVHSENDFLKDDITYIFGHHMQSGAMFGSLKNYDSTQYYWQNPEFRLYTPEKIYTLRIYAVVYGSGTEQITFNFPNEAAFNSTMQSYASRALHPAVVPVSFGDKIVCLCTCAYHIDNGRYFVYCKVMN